MTLPPRLVIFEFNSPGFNPALVAGKFSEREFESWPFDVAVPCIVALNAESGGSLPKAIF